MTDIDKELDIDILQYVTTEHVKSEDDRPCSTHIRFNKGKADEEIRKLIKQSNLALLDRIKEEIPEYWPNCEKYPDSMGTHCNKCGWCKNRNRDEYVTGYEFANDSLTEKLDNIAKEIRGES